MVKLRTQKSATAGVVKKSIGVRTAGGRVTGLDLARRACANHPNAATRTIARHLHAESPGVFKSIDAARTAVRQVRGNIGEANRKKEKHASGGECFRKPGRAGAWRMPEGIRQVLPDIQIDTPGKWLVCGDFHIPYQDARAVNAMLDYCVSRGVKNLYLNGDVLDFHRISRFVKDPRNPDVAAEIEIAERMLAEFAVIFPGRRFFKCGNHDERLETFMFTDAAALLGLKNVDLQSQLNLEQHGYEYVDSKQLARIGKLPILHGHELPKGLASAVNPARGAYIRARESVATNHFHQSSFHTEAGGLSKQITATWSIGCLCDLRPAYAVINKWTHGFMVLDVAEDGTYHADNRMIQDGIVL